MFFLSYLPLSPFPEMWVMLRGREANYESSHEWPEGAMGTVYSPSFIAFTSIMEYPTYIWLNTASYENPKLTGVLENASQNN